MSGQTVTIKKGDTIYSIAKRYGVSVSALMFINKIKDAGTIKPGQVLTVPVINPSSQKGVTAGLDSVHFSKKPVVLKTTSAQVQKPIKEKKPVPVKPSIVEKKPITSEITNYTTAQIKDKIRAEAKKQGVDENLALAVVEHESNFKPYSKSKKNAIGLFQLTPKAIEDVKGKLTYNIDENIEYGIAYLKLCLDRTQTVEEALVAYNKGFGAMKRAKRNGTPIDLITDKKNGQGYAKNVLDIFEINKNV